MRDQVGSVLYVGTEIDGKWWKRYRAPGFSARGNGTFTFEGDDLVFRRLLSKEPTVLPLSAVTGVRIATWHAGKWLAGKPIVKLAWERDAQRLSSGFGFGDRASADAFVAAVQERLRRPDGGSEGAAAS